MFEVLKSDPGGAASQANDRAAARQRASFQLEG